MGSMPAGLDRMLEMCVLCIILEVSEAPLV